MRRRRHVGFGRPRRGLTLLEVLVALAILTVGSTCMVALFSAGLETLRRSELTFKATNLGVEILDSTEDLLQFGVAPDSVVEEVKKRVSPPTGFFYDLALKQKAAASFLCETRITAEGRGKTRTWFWRRTVLKGAGTWVLPLPRRFPRRYARKAVR